MRARVPPWTPLVAVLAWGPPACGPADPCADVSLGDTAGGVSGLALDADHPGWGRSECWACHVAARLHDGVCLPEGAVDVELLRADERPCDTCHGDNGVTL